MCVLERARAKYYCYSVMSFENHIHHFFGVFLSRASHREEELTTPTTTTTTILCIQSALSFFFQSVMIIDASNVLRTPGFVRQPGMLIRARAPNSLLLDLYTPPLPPPSFFSSVKMMDLSIINNKNVALCVFG